MHRRIIVLVSGCFALAALVAVSVLVVIGTDAAPRGTVPLVCAAAVVAANLAISTWLADMRALGAAFADAQRAQLGR